MPMRYIYFAALYFPTISFILSHLISSCSVLVWFHLLLFPYFILL